MSSFGPHFAAGLISGVAGTAAAGIVLYPDFNYTMAIPFLAGICGALTPDMDIKSKSSRLMYFIFLITASILFYNGYTLWAFLLLVYSLIPQFFSHRGFIHSGAFNVLSSLGVFAICAYNGIDLKMCSVISLTYFGGFMSHIMLDY